jgi:hypothetical protein
MGLLAFAQILLVGCAGVPTTVDSLRAEGYQQIRMVAITQTGERRETRNYTLWMKETREAGRRVRFCLMPMIAEAGYNWRITVYIDDKETWTYESGPLSGQPLMRVGIDCTISPSLPEGRLSTRTQTMTWH